MICLHLVSLILYEEDLVIEDILGMFAQIIDLFEKKKYLSNLICLVCFYGIVRWGH